MQRKPAVGAGRAMSPTHDGFSNVPPSTPIAASLTFRGALGKSDAVAAHASPALAAIQPPPTTPLTIRFEGTTLVQGTVGRDVPPASDVSVDDRDIATPTATATTRRALRALTGCSPNPRVRRSLERHPLRVYAANSD